MAFRSRAQERKFHVLLKQGKISRAAFDQFAKDTPKNIPERLAVKDLPSAEDMVKTANVLAKGLGMVKKLGKGAWNVAFGGKSMANGAWEPFHGVKQLGRAAQKETAGPLKGMYKYDAKTGDRLSHAGPRNVGEYFKDAWDGASRTRGDIYAKKMAKKRKSVVNPKKKMNVGEYLQGATAKQQGKLQDINNMSVGQFIKKHPGTAASYYGRNALHKGFMVGLPGYSAVQALQGKDGQRPEGSRAGNFLGNIAEGAGWLGTMPLGIGGALLATSALKAVGRKVGDVMSSPFAPEDQRQELFNNRKNMSMAATPAQQALNRMPTTIREPITTTKNELIDLPMNVIDRTLNKGYDPLTGIATSARDAVNNIQSSFSSDEEQIYENEQDRIREASNANSRQIDQSLL